MNWAWTAQLDALWRSPAFPMWATLAAACFFGLVVLITLLRAERSVANGALAIITLLAIGIAAAATMRGNAGMLAAAAPQDALTGQGALACLDGLAGERVESACEKALFASADSTAAAVSYTAAQISRLPVAASQASSELSALRRVLERDRYGLAAQVLATRDGCTPRACETFRYLVNSSQIAANMNERAFEAVVARHEPSWGDGPATASAAPAGGRPSTIDYPSAASTPPVSIMTAEPVAASPTGPLGLPTGVLPFPNQTPSGQAAAPPPSAQQRKASVNTPPAAAPAKRAPAPPVQLLPQ